MTENKESSGKKGLIIAFIVILLAINAIQFFMNLDKSDTIETQQVTIQGQEKDISGMMAKLDSVETELVLKRKEILRLGGKVSELDKILAEVQKDKEKLLREKNLAVTHLDKYKERIEALTVQLNVSDKKIANLTAQRDSLFKYNQKLTEKMVKTEDSVKTLVHVQQELQEKVAVAASLRAENIQVDAFTDRGKLKEGPELRARHLHKLRVSFYFEKNDLAQVEGKDIYMRLIEPDGSTLFNTQLGGGMFIFNGKEIPYTLHQNILFENKQQQRVAFTFMKGSPYKTGSHTVELFAEGFKIGERKFTVE
jgi:cell division protein ZapB